MRESSNCHEEAQEFGYHGTAVSGRSVRTSRRASSTRCGDERGPIILHLWGDKASARPRHPSSLLMQMITAMALTPLSMSALVLRACHVRHCISAQFDAPGPWVPRTGWRQHNRPTRSGEALIESLHDALELLKAACGDEQPESVDVAVSGCPPRSLHHSIWIRCP